jgi:hypothetical protein
MRRREFMAGSSSFRDAPSVGNCRPEAQASDVQLHIGESILPIVVMDSGLALRAPRNDKASL